MAIANTNIFPKHLDGDINDIFFDEYMAYPSEHDKVAKISGAPAGGHYTEAELSPLGALQTVPEGMGVQFDIPVEGNEKQRTYTKYGLGFQITREMVADDLQRNFLRMPGKLAKSAGNKKETVFWDLFNSGFATHTAIDGNYIFVNATHKTLKSKENVSNRPASDAALSETSLQAAFEYFYGLKDDAGLPIVMRPVTLVVPVALRWTAMTLWKTSGIVGSADNDINTVNPQENPDVPGWKPFISRFLTSSTAWFLLAEEHDFRMLWKEQFRMESTDDFMTGNRLYKTTGRFAVFCNHYRGGYGTSGA